MADGNDGKGNYASVNGIDLYYEVYGSGQPLVMLHGGLGGIFMFGSLVQSLAETRQVIGVELQGHGHTADIDRPIRFESMADDIAALIRHLGYESADVLGYSLGGATALQVAIRHPEVVRKLVVISSSAARNWWYPEVLAGMAAMNEEVAAMMVGSPIHQIYTNVAPRPEDFPRLVGKMGDLLRTEYDWTADVAELKMPVLVVFADADSIPPVRAAEMYGLVGGGKRDAGWDGSGRPVSQLAIVPGTTHYDVLSRVDILQPTIQSFLDVPMPEAN